MGGEKNMSNSHVVAALVGLSVAWGGTALLVGPVGRVLGDPERIATKCREQVALWTLLGTVMAMPNG